jgi:hypothetical protein
MSEYASHSDNHKAKNNAADKIINLCDPYAMHMTLLQCVKQIHSPNKVDTSICPSVSLEKYSIIPKRHHHPIALKT